MSKNLMVRPSEYCCGMVELGNFDYIDPAGGKKMNHFHKLGNSWKAQPNAADGGTTKAQIEERLKSISSAAVICTTGAGQEYVEPILQELGFKKVETFRNPGHANTPVNFWVLVRYKPQSGEGS